MNIEVSDEVYSWLESHKSFLQKERGKSVSFDDVIRDLYDRYHKAVGAEK